MTRKQAIQILIQAGSRDIQGSGLGYRSNTDEWRGKVSIAIARLYKEGYGLPFDKNVAFNLRLQMSDSLIYKYCK